MDELIRLAPPGVANASLVGALRLGPEAEAGPIGKKQIQEAAQTLRDYKAGKANLENRIIQEELWYKLRHWDTIRRDEGYLRKCGIKKGEIYPEPSSAWLFNVLENKHADAMDNFPEPLVLPREASDEQSAKVLSSVLPVVLEINEFEATYSAGWWSKLKHGTAVYSATWDSRKDNGLGDISVQEIDLLRIFWEPGITDIQSSRNLFIVDLVDTDILEQQYPQLHGKVGDKSSVDVAQYVYDDSVDTSKKSVVVDWYYKRQTPEGRTVLHYVKFVGDYLLYASENEPEYAQRGYYDHGRYPVEFDVLFPEEGSPAGFGFVAVCKDPQMYIDKLYSVLLDHTVKATRPRFFVATSTGVNEQEFLDWTRPMVHVEGTLDDTRMRQIELSPVGGDVFNVLQLKIEEMKDTAANRDVNSGGTGSGVTAASAIAALQEAGNKVSRDMIAASYRNYVQLGKLVIELMRQFYDETRSFRVTGPEGAFEFVQFSNAMIAEQPIGFASDGVTELYRLPVFDLKISAQRKNPFSRMEANERAMELYAAGFFNPERAQEALGALEMMDFEGIDKVRKRVEQGATLLNVVQQLQAQVEQLMALAGIDQAAGSGQQATGDESDGGRQASAPTSGAGGRTAADGIMESRTPKSSYTERLVSRSRPKVED